jgi:hypothetical protein
MSKEALLAQVRDLLRRLDKADAQSGTSQGSSENAQEAIKQCRELEKSRASIVRKLDSIDKANQRPGPPPAPVSSAPEIRSPRRHQQEPSSPRGQGQ